MQAFSLTCLECFHIRKLKSSRNDEERALELDLRNPGAVVVHSDYDMQGCSVLETSIKYPEESDFRVTNGLLSAFRLEAHRLRIQVHFLCISLLL